ncbi:TPA: ribosome biogenesis/translation initiation ATPase RLI [Candidatus Bathyarchaeota archaeon]|nr:ribosome biogenesis/translation initiation ATPase RLI [Candidatus Bathyarchaeota archaeon]
MRVAVLDRDKCRPSRCDRACYRFCPQVRSGNEAILFEKEKPEISEIICTGCGICVKKCPFKAISIVNLPDELEKECTHRFGPNAFKLFRLPAPSPGSVLGLIGPNGIGKSTALKILSGEIRLNLGDYSDPPGWNEICEYFRGSTLQLYFKKMSEGSLKAVHKPQYVDMIPKVTKGKVGEILSRIDERGRLDEISRMLDLDAVWTREIDVLSGGELQRVALAAAICREADVYLFDEPSSYLDVKQRLEAARAIRSLREEDKIIIVAEHDLAVLDYLSDYICVLYGVPGVYGIVSHVHGVRTGINIYLDGFIRDENLRFRKEPIRFHVKPPTAATASFAPLLKWNRMSKSYEGFHLEVEAGEVREGEVIGILGPNGIGKTTFIRMIAGIEKPNSSGSSVQNVLSVSYKPQYISSDYDGTVEDLLRSIAKEDFSSSLYKTQIMRPFNLAPLLDRNVNELSGGELQRVTVATCLSRKADLYLLDEPSAYLDVEERLTMVRAIRHIVEERNVAAFVVEHDIVVQDFLADRLMVFTGNPGKKGLAKSPMSLLEGMNMFLKEMSITFRRDPQTKRPRVNKEGSQLDSYQKRIGQYYYVK